MTPPTVLIVNGSLGGAQGNTAELLALVEEQLTARARVTHLELVREPTLDRILAEVAGADAFVFGTGTYWDSWGSPLQRFLEMTAHTEGDAIWVGKPAGVVVTAHATGAKEVVSRLLGVLNVYGLLLPPFSAMAYTYANHIAMPHANDHLRNEMWAFDDGAVLAHNVLEAVGGGRDWRPWPNNSGQHGAKWLHTYSERASGQA
ncbi:MAG: hypothetical protein AMXMBFR81_03870 [Chthonomonas sp.]